MARADVCLQMCESMSHIPARIACMVLLCFQSGILNYYLVHNKNSYTWYAWVGADVALIFVFIVAFWISFKHLMLVRKSAQNHPEVRLGSLPIGYFTWIVYSSALSARVAIIFKSFAYKLDEENFFGQNTLKVTIGIAGVIFLLLLMTHHDARYGTERKSIINAMTWTVVFDILDSIDFLEILFDSRAKEDLQDWMETAIVSVACINFIIPAFPLATLSQSHFGHKPIPEFLQTLHKLSLIFIINVPMMIIRILLWHILSQDVSIFILKNAIIIFMILYEFYDKRLAEMHSREAVDISISYKKGNYEFDEVDMFRDPNLACMPHSEDDRFDPMDRGQHHRNGQAQPPQTWIR